VEIEIGDGKVVQVKEIDELTSGDGNAVRAATMVRIDTETGEGYVPGSQNDRMHAALLARIITGWNLQHALPSRRPDSLEKLTLNQQKLLYKGVEGHIKAIREAERDASGEDEDPTSGDSES
jgi:hypothetical protein